MKGALSSIQCRPIRLVQPSGLRRPSSRRARQASSSAMKLGSGVVIISSPAGGCGEPLQPAKVSTQPASASPRVDCLRIVSVLRSEEHTSELQSLMRISYAVFCLKKTNYTTRRSKDKNYSTDIFTTSNNIEQLI